MKRARNETVEKVKTACSSVCARLWNTRAGNRVLVSGMAGLAALLALLHRMGVPLTGWLPPCPFHRLTGLNCPGCGTTRMLEALLSGDVAEAFSLNPFFFLLTVLAVGGAVVVFPPDVFKRMASRPPPWGNAVLGGSPDPVSAVRRGAQHAVVSHVFLLM